VNPAPRFLSIDDILTLHAIAIEDQGGDASIRDRALLESAIAIPAQQFGGVYLHPDIPEMAAAYAFHICMNHPFVDGNKRAGTAAMIAFLSDNGWRFDASPDEAEREIVKLAAGACDKSTFTEWARKQMHEKPQMELREFFRDLNPKAFTDRLLGLLPALTGATQGEFDQRAHEAVVAMPILRDLAYAQKECDEKGLAQNSDRIMMLFVGFVTLHAIAEDMGYEW